ncbi:MAG TPA: HAD family phosphatase [Patescibacteria group bacterium]|nr:HAD family phosphatase [Patescibacteria group bacterium]
MENKPPIKYIIFDCFGVIGTEVYWPWLQKMDANFEQNKSQYDIIANQCDKGEIDIEEYARKISELTNLKQEEVIPLMQEQFVLKKEVVELISQLKQNYKIGLISDANEDFVNSLFRKHSLFQYFDEMLISSKLHVTKAGPEIFKIFLDRAQTKPNDMIFIDDNPRNTEIAKSLGIHGISYSDFDQFQSELYMLIN